jgi:sensor histidine kinase YesM
MKTNPKISLYWKCQVIGWSVTSLYWIASGWTDDFDITLTLAQFATDVLLYILITHLFRNFSKRRNWHNLPFRQLMMRLVPSVLVLALAYNVLTLSKLYIVHSALNPLFSPSFYEFYTYNALGVFMAGLRLMAIWLLFYYLYHYAQREIRIAKENASLAVIAKDAQLNNLSSQLNPHFLFNSLNTIKGLVHEDPDQATRSIDLLSDLLRNALYKTDTYGLLWRMR